MKIHTTHLSKFFEQDLDKNILNALKNKELEEGDLIQAQTLGEVLESKNKNYNKKKYWI